MYLGVRKIPILFKSPSGGVAEAFIFEVDTTATSAGSSASDQFTFPTVSSGSYNCHVDWGDGNSDDITTYNDAAWTHTYSSGGTYTITITGTVEGIRFNDGGDKLKIGDVSQWGPLLLTDVGGGHFYGCSNLAPSASDYPKIASGLTNFSYMFRGASLFDQDLSSWDTSSGTNFAHMFFNCFAFDQDLSSWDMSSATSCTYMFLNCSSFDQDLSSWDVSSVSNFTGFMTNVTLSTANYDALLIGWEALDLVNSLSCHFGNSTYSAGAAATARAAIIADDLWTVTDGGPA